MKFVANNNIMKGTVNGFFQVLSYILRKMSRYNQDALNCTFRLVAEGRDDLALKVFGCMDRSAFEGQQSLGMILLRVMIIKGRVSTSCCDFDARFV